MTSNIHLKVASNQLRQDLSQIVDNFTLLDILSKEEQELVLETKISSIRRKNEDRMRRHQEIEEDKLQASRDGSTVSSPSSLMSQTPPPDQALASPVQQSTSPSLDSGVASPASSIGKHGEDGAGGWDQGSTGGKDAKEGGERGLGGGGGRRRQDAPPQKQPAEPSSVKSHSETVEIGLHTEGKGMGFGVMNFPGIGVTVKTILPDGVAGKDGRLHTGDLLLQINDTNVEHKSLNEVYAILKQCQGDVRLVVSREIMEVSRGQRREGQRRGPPKDTSSRPQKEALLVTFQNDKAEREPRVKRKVVMRGGNQEDLTISVETEPSKPLGRGGRGRGRTVKLSREEVRRKEFEEKRKENFDRVEAEIAALREALENEKAGGAVNPPSKSVYSFLDDPSRYGAEPQQERAARGNRQDRGWRNQRSRGGPQGENTAGRRKEQGRGAYNQEPDPNAATTVTMTGKERQEYEEWKREREKIDQERIRRHQEAAARQEMRWKPEETETKTTDNQPSSQGEMSIGHWDATDSGSQQRERRTGGNHFEHDDRTGDQRPQHNSRIGSGRFTSDGNQRGHGGGRGMYRGARGQDPGRRGRGGYDHGGSRPGRRSGPSDRELSQMDIRTLPTPQEDSGKSFQESPIGQWQPTSGEDWGVQDPPPAAQPEGGKSAQEVTDQTESLHIGPLPSPRGGEDCKSPLSPLSPFTPTGHTFLTDWAAETEAVSAQGFYFQGDLVYSNSNAEQGS